MSIDKGRSFRVVTSYLGESCTSAGVELNQHSQGNCPHRNGGDGPEGQMFPFQVPDDLPRGEAIFAWAWINREQELFMNCAVVNITQGTRDPRAPSIREVGATKKVEKCRLSGSSSKFISRQLSPHALLAPKEPTSVRRRDPQRAASVQFLERPYMFFANINNGCYSPKTDWELQYPMPGPVDDVVLGDCEYPLELPCGTCGKPPDPNVCPLKVWPTPYSTHTKSVSRSS
jgi:hypothetical protein